MTIKQAIEQLNQFPPDGILMVDSLGHGGAVPLQGFDIAYYNNANKPNTPWVNVEYYEDGEYEEPNDPLKGLRKAF